MHTVVSKPDTPICSDVDIITGVEVPPKVIIEKRLRLSRDGIHLIHPGHEAALIGQRTVQAARGVYNGSIAISSPCWCIQRGVRGSLRETGWF